jgi:hypothetical protein
LHLAGLRAQASPASQPVLYRETRERDVAAGPYLESNRCPFSKSLSFTYALTCITRRLATISSQSLTRKGSFQPVTSSRFPGDTAANRTRRCGFKPLTTDCGEVWLQTQRPLHEGNIKFAGGFGLEDVVGMLNSKVFFWPGTNSGPISYGIRHKQRNTWPSCAVTLRIPTADLLVSTKTGPAKFCPYNSGSPRCSDGKKSPRGPDTFSNALIFSRSAGKVIEVAFDDYVDLPPSTELWEPATTSATSLFCT